jgi:hypothetical protein
MIKFILIALAPFISTIQQVNQQIEPGGRYWLFLDLYLFFRLS